MFGRIGCANPARPGASDQFSSVAMSLRCVAAVLCLLAAPAAALPSPDSAAGDSPDVLPQPSAQDRLKTLLSPVLEEAVSRSQSSWQLSQLAVQLARLELRMDTVVGDVADLKLSALADRRSDSGGGGGVGDVVCPTALAETSPRSLKPESEPVTACEATPTPLPLDAAPHQEPAVRACARSCLQLRNQGGDPQDGVYWFTGMPVPVLCDFSHDGGGWTLLLTAVSHPGWDPLTALSRNPLSPSLSADYSILGEADSIRDLGKGARFAYRIETQAEKGRQRWGGIWLAPRLYSFIDETGSQTEVSRVRFFNKWDYQNLGIKKRMPWLNTGLHGRSPVLTTTTPGGDNWWGTLVSDETDTHYSHSPWIHPEQPASGTVLYWMREEAF